MLLFGQPSGAARAVAFQRGVQFGAIDDHAGVLISVRGPIKDRKRSWDTSPLRPDASIRFAGDLCEVPPGTTSWPKGPLAHE
jgi:hypothetical protein